MANLSEKQTERLKKRLYLTRDCGSCTACCTLLAIPELEKPPRKTCGNLRRADQPGKGGCTVYETRPNSCRNYACIWRSGSNLLEPEARPDRLGIMVDTMRPVPGKPDVRVLLVYETFEGGLVKAAETIRRLVQKWTVIIMTDPRRMFGPAEQVEQYLRDVPEAERP